MSIELLRLPSWPDDLLLLPPRCRKQQFCCWPPSFITVLLLPPEQPDGGAMSLLPCGRVKVSTLSSPLIAMEASLARSGASLLALLSLVEAGSSASVDGGCGIAAAGVGRQGFWG